MTDSDDKIENLAAQYLDLWQKQLQAQASDPTFQEAISSFNTLGSTGGDWVETLNTPEKIQQWMITWADSWKAQFNNGTQQENPFWPPQTPGATPPRPAPEYSQHDMDDLTRRITFLEERVRELESKLKS